MLRWHARPGTRTRRARPAGGRRGRRARRGAGRAWRGGRRQDRPPRVRGRGRARVSDRSDLPGRGRDGAALFGGPAAVLSVLRAHGAPPTAPARSPWRRLRTDDGAGAESVPGRTGGPRTAG